MGNQNEIIDRIVALANTKYPDSEIYLYGSRARGNESDTSDWDILVLLNVKKVPFNIETELIDEFYELELETGAIVSPLVYAKSDWHNNHAVTPLYRNVQQEGIRIK